MTLEVLQKEMIAAMKNKDKLRKDTISSLIGAVKKTALDKNCRDNITEALVDEVLLKSNLPVYTSEQKSVEFMDIADEDTKTLKRKIRVRKKDIAREVEKHQQSIIDDESAEVSRRRHNSRSRRVACGEP